MPLGTDGRRKISNSEVSTWLACQRRYYYQFDLNLKPIRYGDALNRGIIGHEILATYYGERKMGATKPDAITVARKELMPYLSSDTEIAMDLDRILQGYWANVDDSFWRIIAVETELELRLTDDFDYIMRLDLYIQDMNSGDFLLMDHKFVYDFWNADKLELSGQFPKYIGTLRYNNMQVDKAVLNQLRYRSIKNPSPEQLYTQTTQRPSDAKIRRAMKEQIIAGTEIMKWRELPVEERGELATRNMNPQVCNMCPVKTLCMSEFDGGDIGYLIQNDYTRNDYGYNSDNTNGSGVHDTRAVLEAL